MGSWWESLFSPAKNWVARRRLRGYGNILINYVKGIKANGKLKSDLSQMETENKSLRGLEEVEKIIGYSFKNRNLLSQAFTHPSYHKDCVSYERLEYVGDSVLNLLITKEQFSMYPDLPPGLLTPLRAANVDTEKLARVAVHHNFHRYIRLGTPVLRRQIQAFIDALPKHPLHSHGLINAPKVLADVVESTVGAVFVDSNYSIDATWEVASDLLQPIITPEMLQKNPVKKLFEICQKYKIKVKLVDLWSQEGAYKVFINNQLRGKEKSCSYG
ncbi:Ribonuclease III [Handroanthus impetiginosus]|uniref:Ribonuclease III n=1 Tax=Handroanthus impetiginosus TaxID=429701 RepID=A0A2G9HUI2_9LAMI|nr:Ribonuclease III [Handroanthus impetiginosus]